MEWSNHEVWQHEKGNIYHSLPVVQLTLLVGLRNSCWCSKVAIWNGSGSTLGKHPCCRRGHLSMLHVLWKWSCPSTMRQNLISMASPVFWASNIGSMGHRSHLRWKDTLGPLSLTPPIITCQDSVTHVAQPRLSAPLQVETLAHPCLSNSRWDTRLQHVKSRMQPVVEEEYCRGFLCRGMRSGPVAYRKGI